MLHTFLISSLFDCLKLKLFGEQEKVWISWCSFFQPCVNISASLLFYLASCSPTIFQLYFLIFCHCFQLTWPMQTLIIPISNPVSIFLSLWLFQMVHPRLLPCVTSHKIMFLWWAVFGSLPSL
jgi:hypothetical protein